MSAGGAGGPPPLVRRPHLEDDAMTLRARVVAGTGRGAATGNADGGRLGRRGARRRRGWTGVAVRGTVSLPCGVVLRRTGSWLRVVSCGRLPARQRPDTRPQRRRARSVPVRDPGDGYRRGPVVPSDGPRRRTAVPRCGRRLPGGSARCARGAVGGGSRRVPVEQRRLGRRGQHRRRGQPGAVAGWVGRSGDHRAAAVGGGGGRCREAERGTASAAGAVVGQPGG